ncbi:MAG: hypothetical protein ACRCV9_13105 [Burkholderiaceae bacterium]
MSDLDLLTSIVKVRQKFRKNMFEAPLITLDWDDIEQNLRSAEELIRALEKLVYALTADNASRAVQFFHIAFGALGDWGYDTDIGKALATLYRTPGGAA